MIKRNKSIGFRPSDDNQEPEAENKETAQEKQNKEIASIVANLLTTSYDFPDGTSERKTYRTSVELAYELEDIINVQPVTIALVLHRSGCRTVYVDGKVHWELFDKNRSSRKE